MHSHNRSLLMLFIVLPIMGGLVVMPLLGAQARTQTPSPPVTPEVMEWGFAAAALAAGLAAMGAAYAVAVVGEQPYAEGGHLAATGLARGAEADERERAAREREKKSPAP